MRRFPGSVQTGHQFQTSINGIPSTFGGASVLVDGIDASRVDVNGTSNVLGRIESRVNRVSMDSIQEVQVVEQNYSAQYGQSLGAVINPITKSGTNNFHGSIFDYFRNEAHGFGGRTRGQTEVPAEPVWRKYQRPDRSRRSCSSLQTTKACVSRVDKHLTS